MGNLKERKYKHVERQAVIYGCDSGDRLSIQGSGLGLKSMGKIERIEGRYVKMALGVNKNTQDYICKIEMRIGKVQHGFNYLIEMERIKAGRRSRVCTEEIRKIKNRCLTGWEKTVGKAFRRMKNGLNLIKLTEYREGRICKGALKKK